MSNSVVMVTEPRANDSLILVVGEDGTVTPDKETVETYLSNRTGPTELQVMHVNKLDGTNIDVTVDTLMYIHSEEVAATEKIVEQVPESSDTMDEIARNLMSFRMDHDYTPFTSPKRSPSPPQLEANMEIVDELAHTLSMLERDDPEDNTLAPPPLVTIPHGPPKLVRMSAANKALPAKGWATKTLLSSIATTLGSNTLSSNTVASNISGANTSSSNILFSNSLPSSTLSSNTMLSNTSSSNTLSSNTLEPNTLGSNTLASNVTTKVTSAKSMTLKAMPTKVLPKRTPPSKLRAKMINTNVQAKTTAKGKAGPKAPPKPKVVEAEPDEDELEDEEDLLDTLEDFEDDEDDSDFEIEEATKTRPKRVPPRRRGKSVNLEESAKTPKTNKKGKTPRKGANLRLEMEGLKGDKVCEVENVLGEKAFGEKVLREKLSTDSAEDKVCAGEKSSTQDSLGEKHSVGDKHSIGEKHSTDKSGETYSTTLETKPVEKKPLKKEKKVPKPIPDDFALFSTPDIIKRVGGKEPTTPVTPTTPDTPKVQRPAKITMESRSKPGSIGDRDGKPKRLSLSMKSPTFEKCSDRLSTEKVFEKMSSDRSSTERISSERVSSDRISSERISSERISSELMSSGRLSTERLSTERHDSEIHSTDKHSTERHTSERLSTDRHSSERLSTSSHLDHREFRDRDRERRLSSSSHRKLDEKNECRPSFASDIKKLQQTLEAEDISSTNAYLEHPSSTADFDHPMEAMPSVEEIRAVIQNENTKSYTNSLVLPDTSDLGVGGDQNLDQNNMNLDAGGLDIDQSLLDNINSDLISEDILYQVAKSLVDNTELQNVIDKSISDGNLVLDPSVQQALNENVLPPVNTLQHPSSNVLDSPSGKQVFRGGRIINIPPIERPTTRSRNKKVDEVEKPQPKVLKPLDDDHFFGSELESSDDDDEDINEDEDDPNKLWCICNTPHNNRFMICCDTCEEWYHGKCVNVTKAMGQMMEQEGKEWICLYCKDKTLARPMAAARRIRKASRTSTDSAGSSKRSSISAISNEPTSTSDLQCIVCGNPSKPSSIYCSDVCIQKHAQGFKRSIVINRKTGKCLSGADAPSEAELKDWLLKNPGWEVLRSTKTGGVKTTLTQSKLKVVKNANNDGVSLAVQKKGVNVGVLQHAPKGHDHNPKPAPPGYKSKHTNQKILNKQGSPHPSQKQIKLIQPSAIKQPETPIKGKTTPGTPKSIPGTPKLTPGTAKMPAGSPKLTSGNQKQAPGALKLTPGASKLPTASAPGIQKPITGAPKLSPGTPKHAQGIPKLTQSTLKLTPTSAKPGSGTPKSALTTPKTPPNKESKPQPPKTPKPKVIETQSAGQKEHQKEENIRDNVRKTLFEQLTSRVKLAQDLKLVDDDIHAISKDIETQLYKCFGDTGQKYRNKYRSLMFNIKDIKNETLWRRICEKSVNPYQLVRLSPDDLASQELALWREREAKHTLDMIKKSELESLKFNRQMVFKTHKGEQVFEDDRPQEKGDNSEVIATLTSDNTSIEVGGPDGKKDGSKDSLKSGSKHSSKRDRTRSRDRDKSKDRGRSRDRKDRKSSEKSVSKDRKKDVRPSSKDRRKRSRSRDRSRHSDRKKSRSRDRDRHRRSSHKSSRHKKETHSTTDKLDNRSKEILDKLVDNRILPPLEDRLWKHVPQDDIVPTPLVESDSDHEPTSTVTIPTPPRSVDPDELSVTIDSDKLEKHETDKRDVKETEDGGSSPPPKSSRTEQSEIVWKGSISMVDVAEASIVGVEVSGDCNGLAEELPVSLDLVGRIAPEIVWEYIGKMKSSNSKMISLIRLNAKNVEEKMPYLALYTYLSSRNRLGVVKSTHKAIKDFYIYPLGFRQPIPQSLLPINGPGFEEQRPPLLLGIIVRDKRKRPLLDPLLGLATKRSKVDSSSSSSSLTSSSQPPRSYTPPPSRDPRLKLPVPPPTLPINLTAPLPAPLPRTSLPAPPLPPEPDNDEDVPYSPEDSDPETTLPPESTVNTSAISNITTSGSFIESSTPQTFEPFANKFDTIPGLDASSQEIQRKIGELDQGIVQCQAEINSIISNKYIANSEIGQSALASISIPSNLQQILENIKTISKVEQPPTLDYPTPPPQPPPAPQIPPKHSIDLTIPLMLPKLSSRTSSRHDSSSRQEYSSQADSSSRQDSSSKQDSSLRQDALSKQDLSLRQDSLSKQDSSSKQDLSSRLETLSQQDSSSSSPTIPLNLPKTKSKTSALNSPLRISSQDSDKSSVLSSLSEEDLIRKAAEMLGESNKSPANPVSRDPTPTFQSSSSANQIFNAPPPPIIPPINPSPHPSPIKRAKLDLSQPPVPGLEKDE